MRRRKNTNKRNSYACMWKQEDGGEASCWKGKFVKWLAQKEWLLGKDLEDAER